MSIPILRMSDIKWFLLQGYKTSGLSEKFPLFKYWFMVDLNGDNYLTVTL